MNNKSLDSELIELIRAFYLLVTSILLLFMFSFYMACHMAHCVHHFLVIQFFLCIHISTHLFIFFLSTSVFF